MHAGLPGELHEHPLVDSIGAADDLVGRPAGHAFRGERERATGARARQVDRHDHRHAERDPQDGQARLPGMSEEVADAGAQEDHPAADARASTRRPSWSRKIRSASPITSWL